MHDFNMEKISAVIVEDNPHSLQELKNKLKLFNGIEIVGEAANGEDGVKIVDQKQPDLLFLDVELPEMDGFQVLRSVSHIPLVIFVSAHDHYAIRAFDANGLDYLLKPIEKDRLDKALNKVLRQKIRPDYQVLAAIEKLTARRSRGMRFAVKMKDQILIIPKEDVCYFKAEDKYVFLNTWNKSYFYQSTLKKILHTLDPDVFFKINKSVIVSLDKVHKLKRNFKREFCVVMSNKDKSTFKISKRYLAEFRSRLFPNQKW